MKRITTRAARHSAVKASPILLSTFYLALFSYLSGAVQYFPGQGFIVEGVRMVWVYYESASYSGPGLQVFWDSSMLAVRLLVLLLGLFISSLVYVNLALFFRLWNRGLLYSCLVSGAGTGLFTALSALASATYICCGWAPTAAILGVTLASGLGLLPAIISAVLLSLNAYVLWRRLA